MTTFTKESDFEEALINLLFTKGWERKVLKNPTEQELIDNWAKILYDNNKELDRLNGQPLTSGEMAQIIEQINNLRTPLKLNSFINGKTISIKRDNSEDILHFGKEVSLKIYDRREIAAGQSRYQIAQQPKFPTKSKILNNRRGDVMLLINGMPVFHIELKRSGIPVSQASNQIEKYAGEGIFTGLFSLVQIFVAMEPNETKYFANPGPDNKFNPDYYFHWEDFNNEIVKNWKDIAASLLSIPMAHQLIGFYTVADDTDGILKVMRSYQYYAANAISDKVSKTQWDEKNQRGGYIWHTTGSGKTMTSFKSAQLIANSQDADKVIFLMDRIELGTQSLREYRGFADENESVQATENTAVLKTKLKSSNPADTLLVTSIQKMSNIKDDEGGMNAKDIENMNKKRMAFIIDEAHRSTFGDMLLTIKRTFPEAIFFGFTGTPIKDENERKHNTTSDVFGDELHRYTIADGIRDKNVLGFDPCKVSTFKDNEVRKVVAIHEAKATNEEEAISDPAKSEVFYKFMDKIKMAGFKDDKGIYHKGIEDYLPKTQYPGLKKLYIDPTKINVGSEHQKKVVEDIVNNWMTLSRAGKFHAIFATSSIPEAIKYYRLLKIAKPDLKTTALFDSTIDNGGDVAYKEDGLVEIIEDYNKRYGQSFEIGTHGKFKQDISHRLAHKFQYKFIEREPKKQIDLLIVVDQMLTGFDSKWINTLYLDKLMKYENIIQAFSRTNRLFGKEKPHGTIRYYRKPNTMEKNVDAALKLYSGDKPIDLFVDKLEKNLTKMNQIYHEIKEVFENAGVENFENLPNEQEEKAKFASLFKDFNDLLEAAEVQGFTWEQLTYEFSHGSGKPKTSVTLEIDKKTYLILVLRYKELTRPGGGGGPSGDDIPFDLDGYINEIDTGLIDADYMNSRFSKYLKVIGSEEAQRALDELHKTFATLSQEEQKYANIFLHDIQSGAETPDASKTLRDYINEYQAKSQNDQIHNISTALGIDEKKLRNLMNLRVTEGNINEFGRFDDLINTVDKEKARKFIEKLEGEKIKPFQVNMKVNELLRKFILEDGFEI
ncbi:DEAD/DEAH box helicase [Lactococcus hodotermopsidis]|uniref:Type I restriction enzyme endonuclease subunit n=1 Tax=Pseudolactococcus hodotermopsidis TaxID=2709157 RepID=A0A6A0BBB2_9LACT|nr:HsdR family type I site-specific deoxyribonuclease [Lactococcus hodotermopsidis]GFH41758.1 DEAD/DEAH box helicase [Lactococcus hodotermopsidis]